MTWGMSDREAGTWGNGGSRRKWVSRRQGGPRRRWGCGEGCPAALVQGGAALKLCWGGGCVEIPVFHFLPPSQEQPKGTEVSTYHWMGWGRGPGGQAMVLALPEGEKGAHSHSGERPSLRWKVSDCSS